jgi:hypothetical protein
MSKNSEMIGMTPEEFELYRDRLPGKPKPARKP